MEEQYVIVRTVQGHAIDKIQYAQKISVSEKMLMHLPPTLSFEEAAGIPEVG